MVICEKTLVRHLPVVCLLGPCASCIPIAKSLHPSVLTGLCHLSLRQDLLVWHWHLAVFYFYLQLVEKLNSKESKALHLHIR